MKKPENMRPITRSRTSSDQMDRGLGFEGLDNGSSQRATDNRWDHNQHAGKTDPNKTFNFGRGATVGNTGRTANEGPKKPVAAGVPAFEAAKKKLFDGKFNAGGQKREHDGTRPWAPSATENYRGDINSINEGRGPTKGNKQ